MRGLGGGDGRRPIGGGLGGRSSSPPLPPTRHALPHPLRTALHGLASVARFVARSAPATAALYGSGSPADAVRVDAWLDYAERHVKAGPALAAALPGLDEYCALRTHLVGDTPTVADYALWGALQACGQWAALKKGAPHAARWHAHVGLTDGAAALADRYGLSFRPANEAAKVKAAAAGTSTDVGSFDVGLPGAAQGKVVTRFPPEPSGYLHIGHAKAALLNDYFARHYNGKLILRFDDTNPEKESTEFTDSILADLATLGVKHDTLTYTSDYFPQMLDLAERLIKAGSLYADDTPVDTMREERMAGIESKCRTRSVEASLAAWKEMVAGTAVGKATCLRFKMDMAATNKTLCDPVAYRCNDTPHWRTGTTYKVGGGSGWGFGVGHAATTTRPARRECLRRPPQRPASLCIAPRSRAYSSGRSGERRDAKKLGGRSIRPGTDIFVSASAERKEMGATDPFLPSSPHRSTPPTTARAPLSTRSKASRTRCARPSTATARRSTNACSRCRPPSGPASPPSPSGTTPGSPSCTPSCRNANCSGLCRRAA